MNLPYSRRRRDRLDGPPSCGGALRPENYPIVSLRDSAGHVHYAPSFNFSSTVPSKPGEVQTADFTLPSGLAHGTYSLYVSSCGVSSAKAFSFTY